MLQFDAGQHDLGAVVGFAVKRRVDVDQVNLAAQAGRLFVTRQERRHRQQVVAVNQAIRPRCVVSRLALHYRRVVTSADFFEMPGALVLRDPVGGGGILGRQHPFAGLQPDAVTAFQTFENTLGFLFPLGNDFRELFQQTFWHGCNSFCMAIALHERFNQKFNE